jgi:hypothetical protein
MEIFDDGLHGPGQRWPQTVTHVLSPCPPQPSPPGEGFSIRDLIKFEGGCGKSSDGELEEKRRRRSRL